MQKKAIVVMFIVAVLIWVGYMVTRHLGQTKLREETNQETYQDLIVVAKKSPNAGLVHIGLRLNKYKDEKGVYPQRLMDLYPEYLPSEAYINEIQWNYERSGENDFRLEKTVTVNGIQRTTRIDKGLRIASVRTARSTAMAEAEVEALEDQDAFSEGELGVMVASPSQISETEDETSSSAEAEGGGETEPAEGGEETLGPMISTSPEIVTVFKEEIAPGIDSKLGNAYLVWKDENGRLGFGNVDYPSSYKLSVYSNGMYQNIRQPAPLEKKSDLFELTEQEKSKDEIATSISKQTLVWRNKDGTLGFGNVDYPEGENVSHINVNGTWEEKR